MSIFAFHVLRVTANSEAIFLSSKSNVDSFGIMERRAVREVGNFLARQIIPKVQVGQRNVVTHDDYLFITLRWSDGLAVSAFANSKYPPRVAFKALSEIHEHFRETVPQSEWQNARKDYSVSYKDHLKKFLTKYQDAKAVDAITSTNAKVDDVKDIVQSNIERVLGNEPQITQLMETCGDISWQSELLFKQAKKSKGKCCRLQ